VNKNHIYFYIKVLIWRWNSRFGGRSSCIFNKL